MAWRNVPSRAFAEACSFFHNHMFTYILSMLSILLLRTKHMYSVIYPSLFGFFTQTYVAPPGFFLFFFTQSTPFAPHPLLLYSALLYSPVLSCTVLLLSSIRNMETVEKEKNDHQPTSPPKPYDKQQQKRKPTCHTSSAPPYSVPGDTHPDLPLTATLPAHHLKPRTRNLPPPSPLFVK